MVSMIINRCNIYILLAVLVKSFTTASTIMNLTSGYNQVEPGKDVRMVWELPTPWNESLRNISVYRGSEDGKTKLLLYQVGRFTGEFDAKRMNISIHNGFLILILKKVKSSDTSSYAMKPEMYDASANGTQANDTLIFNLEVRATTKAPSTDDAEEKDNSELMVVGIGVGCVVLLVAAACLASHCIITRRRAYAMRAVEQMKAKKTSCDETRLLLDTNLPTVTLNNNVGHTKLNGGIQTTAASDDNINRPVVSPWHSGDNNDDNDESHLIDKEDEVDGTEKVLLIDKEIDDVEAEKPKQKTASKMASKVTKETEKTSLTIDKDPKKCNKEETEHDDARKELRKISKEVELGSVKEEPETCDNELEVTTQQANNTIETPTKVIETPTNVIETPNKVIETPTNVIETPNKVIETPNLAIEQPNTLIEQPNGKLPHTVTEKPNMVIEKPNTTVEPSIEHHSTVSEQPNTVPKQLGTMPDKGNLLDISEPRLNDEPSKENIEKTIENTEGCDKNVDNHKKAPEEENSINVETSKFEDRLKGNVDIIESEPKKTIEQEQDTPNETSNIENPLKGNVNIIESEPKKTIEQEKATPNNTSNIEDRFKGNVDIIESEPKKTIEQEEDTPNETSAIQNNCVEETNKVIEQPNQLTEQPNKLTEQPNMVIKQPNKVTEQPNPTENHVGSKHIL